MDSEAFSPSAYGAVFAAAIGDEPLMPLDAGAADRTHEPVLETLSVEAAFDRPVVDPDAAECCVAAAWLLHGFLETAHTICQDVPTAEGSYWHGVMHRREGDFGNAAYWFRQAGDVSAGPFIASAAAGHPETVEAALGGRWDPIRFNEQVQQALQQGGAAAEACRAVQRAEWRALFDRCWRRAIGQ